ncbi:MAG: prolyl oligopeptidase family serine peptidase [Planctomycetaceae bacterium]|nr:prolyl oligopeptidase family serine peptidase [Planctomycetaceae bacterium]
MTSHIRSLLLVSFTAVCCGFCVSGDGGEPEEGWTANAERVAASQAREEARNRKINYREEKVPDYVLPDPLVMLDGTKVDSAERWREKRRPEILELFRKNVYGRAPVGRPEGMTFEVFDFAADAMDGAATRKQVKINFTGKEDGLAMNLVLFVPNDARKPVPTFLLICNRDPENIDPTRKVKMPFWPAEEVVARGYGIAAFYNGDVDPDKHDEFKNGVHGLFDRPGERPADAWATLAAWAWGASRAMDYFETDDSVDEKHVAVVGHSRGGKTALWAGAEDERFAMVVSNDSGCGGAALSRRCYGETVAQINRSFPHWFCDNFEKFNDNEGALPVDQHMLMALAAPRLLCVASADEDLWADPRGEFLSAVGASPVYELFGLVGLGTTEMPPLDRPVQKGNISYHIRTGGHGLTEYDWEQYMNFADEHWGKK